MIPNAKQTKLIGSVKKCQTRNCQKRKKQPKVGSFVPNKMTPQKKTDTTQA